MGLNLRWVGEEDWDRVTKARLHCYAPAARELDSYAERLRVDPRNHDADIVLAEEAGVSGAGAAVGTATALHLTLWARGGAVPCQGVAWVGTIKTHRRGGSKDTPGIATQVMWEVLRRGRERGQVVSALMPFRASFYEHFGYGLVERRHDWTLPLDVLPRGDFAGVRFYEPADFTALVDCRQRVARAGQCDMERSAALWELYLRRAEDGFVVVDRPDAAGPVRGWVEFRHAQEGAKTVLRVTEIGYEAVPDLLRLLHFMGGLKDQYATAVLSLPPDVRLNLLLRETQLPHRPVNHAVADVRPYTRMQLRVLDHKRFVEAMHLPPAALGAATVAVHETEGHVTRLRIAVEGGRARVTTGDASGPAFECRDVTWAAVVCGDLPATTAVGLGLATCADRSAAELLDVFGRGPAPYSLEYF